MNKIQMLPAAIIILVLGCSRADQEQENKQATVSIHVDRVAKPYDPMIFGGFIEHFGRQIYGGFFEPGSPLADEKGLQIVTDINPDIPIKNNVSYKLFLM